MKIDENIKFEERYDDDENNITTLYFNAPVKYLKLFLPALEFPEAVGATISLEASTEKINVGIVDTAGASISPQRRVEDAIEDYDWYDIELSYNEIEELINLALMEDAA